MAGRLHHAAGEPRIPGALFHGADRDWVRNVLAAGSCTLERGGRRVELTAPRMLDISEGMTLVPPLRGLPGVAARLPYRRGGWW